MTALDPIVAETPVLAAPAGVAAGRVAIYTDRTGRVLNPDGAFLPLYPRLTQARTRYEVDVGVHTRTLALADRHLAARGNVYYFDALLDLRFQVTDAPRIVATRTRDLIAVLTTYLVGLLRPMTSTYPIEDAAAAERDVNEALRDLPELPEGVTIHSGHARLAPDADARGYLRERDWAVRERLVSAETHQLALARAEQEARRALAEEEGRRRRVALGDGADAATAVADQVRRHLAENPQDTAAALALLHRCRRRDGDAGRVGSRDAAPVVTADWGAPRTDAAAAAPRAPVPRRPAGGPGPWSPPLGVLPVYLMFDQSDPLTAQLPALRAALAALYTATATDREVAAGLRLSVIGFGERVAVYQPLTTLTSAGTLPSALGGPTRYAAALDAVRERLAREVAALKAAQPVVHRPLLLLLAGSAPVDDAAWRSAQQRLTDRTRQRYAPCVVAAGFGTAPAALVAGLASRRELAFRATGAGPDAAIARFFDAAAASVTRSGQSILSRRPQLAVKRPDGFRLLDSPAVAADPPG